MEIISGIAGGIRLEAPRGLDVRPTAVRARKALFDSLGPLDGKVVADFFAGSGALGLEAASRGASDVVFIEDSPASLASIGFNCASVTRAGVLCRFHVLKGRLPAGLDRAGAYPAPDLIFADPPYAESAELLKGVLEDKTLPFWAEKASIIWEMPGYGLDIDSIPQPWKIRNVRQFGPAKFLILGKAR
jgi:16S rRNA (guanine966-N2)-methyltransferase